MPFSVTWHTILDELEEVPPDTSFHTPLSGKPFRLEDVQEHRLLISYREQDTTIPLKRDHLRLSMNVFLSPHSPLILIVSPADAEPYATIFCTSTLRDRPTRGGCAENTDSPTSLLARRRLTYCRKPRPRNRP